MTGVPSALPAGVLAGRNGPGRPPSRSSASPDPMACPTGRARMTCQHSSPCPPADAPDRQAARVIASHPEQGWSLLCNGVVIFEDTGVLLPDGSVIEPRRVLCQPGTNGT